VQCKQGCPLWAKSGHREIERPFRNSTTPPKRGRIGEPGQLANGCESQIPLAGLLSASFSPALLVSKRIFEKVLVSFLKLILKAKDLKAIVSTDGPKL